MKKNITDILINLFETTSQLDILYKEAFGDVLKDYSFSEMHCIDAVGRLEHPNVTKIARKMNVTKAAISKCIKKLISKKAVTVYKNPENKKEIYYKLTQIGRAVYDKHLNMHEIWCKKDDDFFSKFGKDKLDTVFDVLSEYTKLLESRLKNIKEDLK